MGGNGTGMGDGRKDTGMEPQMVKGYRNKTVGVSRLAFRGLRGWRFAVCGLRGWRLAVYGGRFMVGVLWIELSSCSFAPLAIGIFAFQVHQIIKFAFTLSKFAHRAKL